MMATRQNKANLPEQALASFFKEIVKISKAAENLVWGDGNDLQKRDALRDFAIFTRIIEHYERLIGDDKLISLDELPLKLYDSYLTRKGFGAPHWLSLDPYDIGNLIREYYVLDADRMDSARFRSDELMAIKLQADVQSHMAVWDSTLPVDLICSTVDIYGRFEVTVYEREAYRLGHDTKLWHRYGYWVLMILSPDQLSQAEDRFLDLEPQGNLKELSAMAKFKQGSMDANLLLDLLGIGYSSVDQLRQAGEILGVGVRSKNYFSQILAGGSALARAAHANANVPASV